jgi:hypothetical protein
MLNKIKTTMILVAGLFMFANEADAQTGVNKHRSNCPNEINRYQTQPDPLHKYGYSRNYKCSACNITDVLQLEYFRNDPNFELPSCYPIDE